MKSIYKKWGLLAGITVLAVVVFGFQDDLFQIAKNLCFLVCIQRG